MNQFLRFTKIQLISILFLVGISFVFNSNYVHAQALTSTDLGLTSDVGTSLGLSNVDIRVTIAKIIRAALAFLGIIAVLITMYGGFVYLTSGGSDEKVGKAKKIIINGVIGIIIILSSYGITSFVISRLVGATNGSGGTTGGGGGPCVGPGCNPFSVNQFGVRSLPPAMTYCVKNVKLAVVFNTPVNLSTVAPNVQVRDVNSGNAPVPGTWTFGPNQNTILFTPTGVCDVANPAAGNDCLKSNSPYSLVFTNAPGILSQVGTPPLSLNCTLTTGGFVGCGPVNFTSGNAVDRTPPTITISSPPNNSSFSAGSTNDINLTYTDDNGVQNTSLYVNNPAGGAPRLIGSVPATQCLQTATVTIPWNTIGFAPNNYTLTAYALDFAGQSDSAIANYTLRPSHCFDGVQNLDEVGLDCGGLECGVCAGGPCTTGGQCASGVCTNGRCINAMVITGFSPSSGAPGTFVSVFGKYFGTTTGRVYFSNILNPNPSTPANWVEAFPPAACGTGFSYWGNNQIIVGSPVGAAASSTIMVVTAARDNGSGTVAAETDLTSSHGLLPFGTNSIVRPGLCSMTPNVGTSGDSVSLTGVNFGATLNPVNDNVRFDTMNARVLTGGGGTPAWSDTFISAAVPGIDTGAVGVKVVNNTIESNSLRYSLTPGLNSTYPIIDSISTSTGARGEYLTITGRNFGTLPGRVTFRRLANDSPILGNFVFPVECRSNVWTDTRIIVKAPPDVGGANALTIGSTYVVQVVTGDASAKESPYDSRISFGVINGSPSPGICLVSPSSLPKTQLASSTIKVGIWGEYFTLNQSAAYFWGAAATNPNLILGRQIGALQAVPAATITHLTVVPTSQTITGPLSVARTLGGDNKISSPANFAVQDCTDPGVTCSAGSHCCSAGTQIGACISDSQVCNGVTTSTGYLWRFSTQDIPAQPRVLERCDSVTETGAALPSPSPSINWDANSSGDSYAVCQTALVTIEFTSNLAASSVNQASNNVRVYSCASYTNNVCNSPTLVTLNPSSYILNQATVEHDYLQLNPASPWAANTWYQVALMPGIIGDTVGVNLPLQPTRPCTTPTGAAAYCFAFQGGGQACKLRTVAVTPYNFFTEQLQSPLKNLTNGSNVVYRGLGLSGQRCIMMNTSNLTWAWTSENTTYSTIFGPVNTSTALVSSIANTVGVGLLNDRVNIRATATVVGAGAQTLFGVSPLTIDLTKPSVIDWWPKCESACLNTDIGVKFNVTLSDRNLNQPQTVRLLKCNDENCIGTTRVGGAANYTLQDNKIVFSAGSMYDPVKGLNLAVNGYADSGDNTNFTRFNYSTESHAAFGSFAYSSNITGYPGGNQKIPIDHTKTYFLELWAKSGDAGGTANYNPAAAHYTGVLPLDADGIVMHSHNSYKLAGSVETTLVQPLVRGVSTQMVVADATGWHNGANSRARLFAWWPYTNAKGFTYPNYTYSRNLSMNSGGGFPAGYDINIGAWPAGGIVGNTINLVSPWSGPNLPAGTPIRNVVFGYDYPYLGVVGNRVPTTWTRYSGYIAGANVVSTPYARLPRYAENVSLLFFVNYYITNGVTNTIRFSDVWFSDPSTAALTPTILEPNTLYKVSVSAYNATPLSATNNIWSRQIFSNPSSYSRPFNEEFSWRFRTKDTVCATSRVEVSPNVYSAQSITERKIYEAEPYSAPDACSDVGQKLNPWLMNWNWSSGNPVVATISSFSTLGTNPYCNAKCILRGSTIAFSATSRPPLCGNLIVEAGEDCDQPNTTTGCGLNCRFLGDAAPPLCPNGTVNSNEACDPLSVNPSISQGCTANCMHTGSLSSFDSGDVDASNCGNGTVGAGEDCDLGIAASSTNKFSSMGCSGSCLHLGSPLSSRWCHDNRVARRGFSLEVFNQACANSASICGDGITGPDEDQSCETGIGTKASWCNDRCIVVNTTDIPARNECTPGSEGCDIHGQRLGSSLNYSIPSRCGDGVIGIGEDSAGVLSCETNLFLNTHSFSDPWALAIGVGRGSATGVPPAQRSVISATTINSTGQSITGRAEFNIVCGYKTDADCSVLNSGGVVYGVGSDSCCYARPALDTTLPLNNATSVCLNSAIYADFNGLIDPASFMGTSSSNIVIARGEVGPNCASGETNVTSLVLQNIESDSTIASGAWYEKMFNNIKNLFVRLLSFTKVFAAPTYTANVWCAGTNNGSLSVVETSSTTSRVSIALVKPLISNSHYTVILKEGLRSTAGVSIGQTAFNRNFSFTFDTDSTLCQINSVQITPSAWYFSVPNSTTSLRAEAVSERGIIQSIPGMYAWDFIWAPTNSPFVTVSNVNTPTNLITAQNRNGEVDVRALARLTSNTISSVTGTIASGASHITVFLCENPWPPKYVGSTPVFPYNDSNLNNSGFDLVTNLFNGTRIPAATTGVGDGYFNFSTYYCADNGSFGRFDDFPYLKVAVQHTPANLQVNIGVCEDNNNACTADPMTGFSTDCGNNIKCLTTSPLKRFIFTNDKNTDGIGIQIFKNPNHLSSMDWYRSPKALGGQGFGGEVQTTNLGGYEAVSDGNNIYVSGLNYTNSGNLYDVVYLLSINSDAKEETRKVFEEMAKNFKFNINTTLSHNDGYCGVNIATPSYTTKCTSDLDCPVNEVCSNQVAKLQRNHQRLVDLKKLDNALDAYYLSHNGTYPSPMAANESGSLSIAARNYYPGLKTGTYLAGQSVSTWPSWTQIGQELGISTPSDPVNKLAPAGSCSNQTTFCNTDADCGTNTPCTMHDPSTGWSTVERRFSFACNDKSLAYRYIATNSGYYIRTRFEDPGVVINNLTAFTNGYNFSDNLRFPNLTNWSNTANLGICETATELSTSNKGNCGDSIINRADGEDCDPPGNKVYDKSLCTAGGGNATVRTCDSACHWGASQTVTCLSLAKCGNSIVEPGEFCDSGALNGRYGQCNATCTGSNPAYNPANPNASPGFCGDGFINPKFEVCDTAIPGVTRYNLNQASSCAANCQNWGSFCGDARIDSADSEECDYGSQNGIGCTSDVYGTPCSYCSANCKNVTASVYNYCGDGVPDVGYEYCDWGTAFNSDVCVPGYNSTCYFCSTDCQNPGRVDSTQFCGNNVTEGPEVCDNGAANGSVCIPAYNATCTSCNGNCTASTFVPRQFFCGDGVIQATYETCDGNTACTGINGLSGSRVCLPTCQLAFTPAQIPTPIAWWPLGETGPNLTERINSWPTVCVTPLSSCPPVATGAAETGANSSVLGSGTGIDATINNNSINANGFSIEFWIKPTYSMIGIQQIFVRQIGPSRNLALYLNPIDTNRYYLLYYIFDPSLPAPGYLGGTTGIFSYDTQWKNLILTFNFSGSVNSLSLLMNGAMLSSVSTNRATSLFAGATYNALNIGYSPIPLVWTGSKFSGNMDNVRIYNRALSLAEETVLYNSKNDVCDTAPPICTGYNYSAWGTCQSNGTQTRTVISTVPTLCKDGPAPVLSQSCTYTVPTCVYTYSSWGLCQPNGTQTRTIATTLPVGCAGGAAPVLSQSCVYTAPACAYTYSAWSACQSDSTKTRSVISTSPTGCVGTPILEGACIYSGGGGSCFAGETQVLTPNGLKHIEFLNEGDEVISYDENSNKNVVAKVSLYRKYIRDHYYLINNSVRVTREHKFAVLQEGKISWTEVYNLHVGDIMVSDNGQNTPITSIEYFKVPSLEVYNPALSWPHTYYVLVNGTPVLVHNLKCTNCAVP